MTRIAHYTVFSFLTFLFISISCLNDEDVPTEFFDESFTVDNQILGKTGIDPENTANPFDSVGINHNLYLESFWENFADPVSITDAINKINILTGLGQSKISANNPSQKIQDILNDPVNEFEDALEQTISSSTAKDELIDFIDFLEINKHQEFTYLHSFITGFEDDVLNDTMYSAEDKRIILCLTSFIRHGLYLKKRRDDKDWDISIASRTGALLGAVVDEQTAVYWALLMGISEYAF
ncbi:hypothetical protein [Moheibacter sp.]|uniref:hypothetical protein n=1 Tax=Moheibacter sp. TaxID=1965316 RepID=UPI003C71A102